MQKEKRKQSNDEEDDSSSRKRRKADLSKPVSFISTASMTEPESSRLCMAYPESPFSSSSSSSRHRWNYDVFLSFRGEDTRKTITDHLYHALIQAGIHTFRDDNELPRGEEISPQLLRAIEGSRISVVVFSTNYASSRWCLDELVKIIECRQKIHQVVLPIFYDMDPSDIRKQTGSYAKAFDEHEEHFKGEMEKVNRWREALTQAANLSGYGLKNDTNGHEAEFIKRVVNDVACKLGNKTLNIAKHPVGISSRVRYVISLLKGARNSVGIVGIYGIAGIGKTTIAKAVFNKLYFGFEGSSFLSGVKERSDKPNGLVKLQERLLHDILKSNVWKISNVDKGMNLIKERLHRKNVLVVFDDVDKREQLEALMGERCWFGDGSKIIVVTKNKYLLKEVEVDGMYHAKELDRDQSLQLFSLHAFRETRPAKDYEELSEKVVDYCEGLPLALEILGSHLSIRDKAGWKIDIAHWQNIPHDDIQAKLRVSFDALVGDSSEIFLDIACFFVGKDKDYVADIVGARYDCHPEVAFRALIGRSLIEINILNRLWMHDIVRKMGREIIRQRSRNHPGNCSRIVLPKDAHIVLSKEMGTEAVEGLALDIQGSFSTKSFTKMRRLQLLQITGAVHLVGSYSLLPRELIWLYWPKCPLKSLPSDFHLSELVMLDMQGSKVRKLWKGTKILNKLKILNLSYSKCLFETPNCLGLSSLERLILVDCTGLVKVHQSIGNLKSLVLLNLKGCNSLKNLPESMGNLKSLQTLNVIACSQLEKLPESLGDLESLTELFAKGTGMKQLPTSARYLKKLTKLALGGYKNVFCSPDPPSKSRFSRFSSWFSPKSCSSSIAMPLASFTGFSSLTNLDLSDAGLSDAISSTDFGSLSFLEVLDLSGNGFFHLPSGISRLSKLMFLTVERCENLLSISELPPRGRYLYIDGCTSIERVSAPPQLGRLPQLEKVSAKGCRNLIEIQGMEFAGNNWSIVLLDHYNNLSEKSKMSLIQGFCKGKEYDFYLDGCEIPEWFSHRGEGSALSFHLPSVSVPYGNQLQALLFWVVFATPHISFPPYCHFGFATLKNKSNGIELFDTWDVVTFDRNSTKHSWIKRVPLTGLEESLQGVEELELNVKIGLERCWVEKCGVHLIMEKSKADSDIDGEKGDHEIDIHALGSSTTDDQRLESSLIRELQKWKIINLKNRRTSVYLGI